ncbi:hypothetical protein BN000_05065 [Mycobacterium europaeum]|uniref:Uncharacterized protein n=1 Tax=Mycobacterium europaeum TaxID=761804 RepID=A0A0U1DQD9_9MYCO|nr:hypothetical protein BN000_05065 [Mycobacterium europaeum]
MSPRGPLTARRDAVTCQGSVVMVPAVSSSV